MKVGLFFGSFNPIHIGHLIIGNYVREHSDLDQIWFVVSPQNPFKKKSTLLNDYDRLHLVELAIEGNDNFRASNIEFSLPQPSYTIDTLTFLKDKHPENEFSLIMGSDNLLTIDKWKNYEALLKYYRLLVYQRPGFDSVKDFKGKIQVLKDVPLLNISSSKIRMMIKDGHSIKYLVTEPVAQYIKEMNLYK